jgi:hypothetical protein
MNNFELALTFVWAFLAVASWGTYFYLKHKYD